MTARISLILPLLLGAVACARSDAGDGTGRAAAPATGAGGARVLANDREVVNPARPVYGDGVVRVDTLWRVSGSPSAPWKRPLALAVDRNDVMVLDRGAVELHVVSRAGTWRYATAYRMDRMLDPTGIAWVDGRVAVADRGYHGLLLMDQRDHSEERVSVGDEPWVAGLASTGEFLTGVGGGEGVRRYHRGGGWYAEMIGLDPPPPADTAGGCTTFGSGPWILRAGCRIPVFHVLSRDGRLLRRVSIDEPPPAVGMDSVEAALARGEPVGDLTESVIEASGYFTIAIVRGVRFDPASRRFALWRQAPRGGARVDLFSVEGVYLASFSFPAPWTDFAFEGSTLYALEEPRAGRPGALTAYRVALPENVTAPAPPAKLDSPDTSAVPRIVPVEVAP